MPDLRERAKARRERYDFGQDTPLARLRQRNRDALDYRRRLLEADNEARQQEASESFQTAGNELGGILTGAQAGAASLMAPIARQVGDPLARGAAAVLDPFAPDAAAELRGAANEGLANRLHRVSEARLGAQAQKVEEADMSGARDWLNRNLPGVSRSLTQMTGLAATGTGALGMAAGFGVTTADESYTTARDLGVKKKDAIKYAATQGGLEAAPMLVFHGLGKLFRNPALGGVESAFLREGGPQLMRDHLLKQIPARVLSEMTEEQITTLGQNISTAMQLPGHENADDWVGEDGSVWNSPAMQAVRDTASQTILTMGLVETANTAKVALQDKDELNEALIQRFATDPSRKNYDRLPGELKTLSKQNSTSKARRQELLDSEEFQGKLDELAGKRFKFGGEALQDDPEAADEVIDTEAQVEGPAFEPSEDFVNILELLAEYDPTESTFILDQVESGEIEENQAIAAAQQAIQGYLEQEEGELGSAAADILRRFRQEYETDQPLPDQELPQPTLDQDIPTLREVFKRIREAAAGLQQEPYQLEPLPSPQTGNPALDLQLRREDELGTGPEAQAERERRLASLDTANRRRFDSMLTSPVVGQQLVQSDPALAERIAAIEDPTPEAFLAIDPGLEDAVRTSPEVLQRFRDNVRRAMGIGPQSRLQDFSTTVQRRPPTRRGTPQSLQSPKPVKQLRPDGKWHLIDRDLDVPEGVPGLETDEFQGRRYARWTQSGQDVKGTPPLKVGDSIQYGDGQRGVIAKVRKDGTFYVKRQYSRFGQQKFQGGALVDSESITKNEGPVGYPVTIQEFHSRYSNRDPDQVKEQFLKDYAALPEEEKRRYLSFLRSFGIKAGVNYKPETIADNLARQVSGIADMPYQMARAAQVIIERGDETRVPEDGDGLSDDRFEAINDVRNQLAEMGISLPAPVFAGITADPDTAVEELRRLAEEQFDKSVVDDAFSGIEDEITAPPEIQPPLSSPADSSAPEGSLTEETSGRIAELASQSSGSVEITEDPLFKRIYIRSQKWRGKDDALVVASVEATQPGQGAFRKLHDELSKHGKPIIVEEVVGEGFDEKLTHLGYRDIGNKNYRFDPAEVIQDDTLRANITSATDGDGFNVSFTDKESGNTWPAMRFPTEEQARTWARAQIGTRAERNVYPPGSRVSWTDRNGDQLTGTVDGDTDADGLVKIRVDQISSPGGVPVGRISHIRTRNLRPLKEASLESRPEDALFNYLGPKSSFADLKKWADDFGFDLPEPQISQLTAEQEREGFRPASEYEIEIPEYGTVRASWQPKRDSAPWKDGPQGSWTILRSSVPQDIAEEPLKDSGVSATSPESGVDTESSSAPEAVNYGTPQKPNQPALSDFFLEKIRSGQRATNKNGIRTLAKEALGEDVEANTPAEKQVQEAYELALVKRARERIAEAPDQDAAFEQLVTDYQSQPTLGIRSSSSRRNQAYSTPAPLAYLANTVAGVGPESTVYDSSAGNGMLFIGADVANVKANELQKGRVRNLESQGIKTANRDATEYNPGQAFDAVIVNPPFGTVSNEGVTKTFQVDDYQTNQIDRAIALKALKSMKSDGRAVLILGSKAHGKSGNSPAEIRYRNKAYKGKQNVAFFNELYDNYNVVSHSVVDGDLYRKMGAGFSVDMIVIDGKGKSSLPKPYNTKAKQPPGYYESWEDLWDALADERAKAGLESGRSGTGDTSQETAGGPDTPSVSSGPQAESPVAGGDTQSGRSGGDVSGTVGGEVAAPEQSVPESGDTGTTVSGTASGRAPAGSTGVPSGRTGESTGGQTDSGDAESGRLDSESAPAELTPAELEAAFQKEIAAQLGLDNPSETTEAPEKPAKPRRTKIGDKVREADQKASEAPEKPAKPRRTKIGDKVREADQKASEALQEAVDEVNDILGEMGFFAGIPATPRLVKALSTFTVRAIQKGATSFSKFVVEAVEQFGESRVRQMAVPLEAVWNALHSLNQLPAGSQRVEAGSVVKTLDDQKKAEKARQAKEKASREEDSTEETEHQITYKPRSRQNSLSTFVPRQLQDSIDRAMDEIEDEYGQVDKFVAKELGLTVEEMTENGWWSAEQVDALAMGIHNHKKGNAFIVGDQTGIGKGRVVAGMMKYAEQQGMVPVFVTERAGLFGDMIRDLTDTGISTPENRYEFLYTNDTSGSDRVVLKEGDNSRVISTSLEENNSTIRRTLNQYARTGKLKDPKSKKTYRALFTTYSQMQPVPTEPGQPSEQVDRHEFLRTLAPNAFVIMDESHKAGGSGESRAGEVQSRAEFAREVLANAAGAMFASATYAKKPRVMDLYAITGMDAAVENPEDLREAIDAGGVPLQQVVSAMLAESGKYVRRERTYDGVDFDVSDVNVDMANVEQFAESVRGINDMYRALATVRDDIDDEGGEGGLGGITFDNAVGDVSVSSTTFTSLLHNIIDNMLASLKADSAAQAAIDSVRAGESPIITVDKTLQSRLLSFIEENGIGIGGGIDMTFKDVMRFYLKRARRVTLRDDEGNIEHIYIEPEDMPPTAREAYEHAALMVEDMSEDMPASPIDWMKYRLEKEGIVVREITGRNLRINYADKGATLERRDQAELGNQGKDQSVDMFNNGDAQVIIMNQSAASGVSMHASTLFKNQNTRRMIIAEPDKNVDTFMQLLGRIHRTGQKQPPNYTLLLTDAPAEKRPAAVLMKKLASLNANVTGKSKGKVGFENVTDVINEVGDVLVTNFMIENQELHDLLGQPLGDFQGSTKGNAAKVTGWLPMAEVDTQNEFWDAISEQFVDAIEELNRANRNPLMAQTMDYQARTISTLDVFEGDRESSNPFARPAKMETAIINVVQKPHSSQTVRDRIAKFYELDDYSDFETDYSTAHVTVPWHNKVAGELEQEFSERIQPLIDRKRAQVEGLDAERQPKAHAKASSQLELMEARYEESRRVVQGALLNYAPGEVVSYKDQHGEDHRGVVTSLVRSGHPINPYTNGSWKMTIAVADGMREFKVPLTQLGQVTRSSRNRDQLIDTYDDLQQTLTEERHIVTGNLLAGVDKMQGRRTGRKIGQITFFTDNKGELRHGILMPQDFSVTQWAEQQPVPLETVDHAVEFLRHNGSAQLTDVKGLMSIGRTSRGQRKVEVRNNNRAAIYHQDSRILELLGEDNEFAGTGKWMSAGLPADIGTQRALLTRLMEIGDLQASTRRDEARRITGTQSNFERDAYAGDPTRPKMRGKKASAKKDEADKKQVRVDQIVARWAKDFEIHIADGRPLTKKAFAEYRGHEGIIRAIRSRIGDLGMLAHEVAHGIDDQNTLVKNNKGLPTRVATELMQNDYEPSRVDPRIMKSEGFAEFVRQWMTDTDSEHKALRNRMKNTMAWWDGLLKENPDLARKLNNARSLVDRYYSQTPRALARSQIRSAPDEVRPVDETMSERLSERVDQTRERFNKAWIDRLSPIQLFDKATQAAGYKLKEGESLAHALASGFDMTTDHHSERAITTGIHTVDMGKTEILADGLDTVLANAEIDRGAQSEDYDRAVEYAVSRFQLEYAEINPEYRGAWSHEVSESIIDGTSPSDAARYDIFTDGLSDYARGLLKLKVRSGVLTKQEANRITKDYKTFIPLWRAVEGPNGTGKKGTVDLSNRVRRRSEKGSDAPLLDPMIALIEDTRLTYDRVLKEEVLKQVGEQWQGVSLKGKASLKNFIEEIPETKNVTALSVGEISGQIRKEMQSQGIDPDFLDDPEIAKIMVKVYRTNVSPHATAHHVYLPDGKGGKTLVKMNEHLFDALLGSSPVVGGLVGKILGGFTKAQKLGATGWSTAFAFGNMFRDWQQYQRTSRYQGNPLKRAIDPFTFAGAYIAQRYLGKENQVAELYREWAGMLATRFGEGGRFKGVDVRDSLMEGPQDERLNLVWKAGQKVKQGARNVTEFVAASDVGPRLAEFSNVLKSHGYKRGKDGKVVNTKTGKAELPPRDVLVEAITAANDVTVNFKKRGDTARNVSKFIPFFSAAIAGLNKFKRVWWDGVAKGDRTQANREAVVVSEMVTAALTIAYVMARWDDDDYEEEDTWLKNYWTFTDGDGTPVMRLPKGREDALISNIVEASTVAFLSKSPEPYRDMAQVVRQNFMLPFQAALISPLIEASANKDLFRGMDIEYDGPGAKSPQQRKREYTTATAELFSHFLGKLPGDNISRTSPIRVDFIIDRLSGGLGRPVLMLGEAGLGSLKDLAFEGEVSEKRGEFAGRAAGKIQPLARFFLNRDYGKSVGEFYDLQKARSEELSGYEDKDSAPAELRYSVYKDTQVREILRSVSQNLENVRNRADRFRLEKYSAGLTRWALGKEPLDRYPNPFTGRKMPDPLSKELDKQLEGWIKSAIGDPQTDDTKRQKAQAIKLLKETGVSRAKAIRILEAAQSESKMPKTQGARRNLVLKRNKQKRTLRSLLQ